MRVGVSVLVREEAYRVQLRLHRLVLIFRHIDAHFSMSCRKSYRVYTSVMPRTHDLKQGCFEPN